jgi:hypothetical protein
VPNRARQICAAFARIAWKIGSRLPEEELITVSTSAVAACCSSASLRSRVSRATFVSLPAAGERRPRVAFGANVLRRCVLASLPPILERRLNCSPEARERSSYQLKVAFRKGLGVRRPMSALGQKQTYAVQNRMSALPPIATSIAFSAVCFWAKADIGTITSVQESNAATRGKVTLISVNSPGFVSTSIEPPCCFTMMS